MENGRSKARPKKTGVEAKVPGSVYENLMNAGLIEDPFLPG